MNSIAANPDCSRAGIFLTRNSPPDDLKDLFKGARAGLVFVTSFLTRRAMTRYLADIAWETEVWVAEAPSHIIHFNGERFLGPYR